MLNRVNRHSIDYVKSAASKINIEILEDTYTRNDIKMKCKCLICDFLWMSSFKHIQRGQKCPRCAHHIKHTIEEAKQIAIERGGRCLSNEYKNADEKLQWECGKCGRIWWATFSKVYCRGDWCIVCGKARKRNTLDDCRRLAKEHGELADCLLDVYVNASEILLWVCENGHKWEASYNSVRSGRWCSSCNESLNQRLIHDIIASIFVNSKIHINYRGFDWLKTYGTGKQEIDIYVEDIKLAIEYDGQQHFKPVCFGGIDPAIAEKLFENVKRLDKLKDEKIAQHKEDVYYFLRFNYKDKITEGLVRDRVAKARVIKDG